MKQLITDAQNDGHSFYECKVKQVLISFLH